MVYSYVVYWDPTNEILGSKSRLAEFFLQNTIKTIESLMRGKYGVTEKRMLEIRYGKSPRINILTDVCLEHELFVDVLDIQLQLPRRIGTRKTIILIKIYLLIMLSVMELS